MKAAAFGYVRPATLAEACALIEGDRDAKILAGGQSLLPALAMRLSTPEILVDINRIEALRGIERRDRFIRIGALARHAEVAASPLVAEALPLISQAMHHVAHPAVRNRGTTCGSIAYADPSAEMPACAVALDAILVLASSAGTRQVAARSFFHGFYETERRNDEILIEALFPVARPDERFGFAEVALRHGDFPSVGVAAKARLDGKVLAGLDLVLFGSEPAPLLSAAGALAAGQSWSRALSRELTAAAIAEMDPMENHQGNAETKRRQAATLITRLLDRMLGAPAC
jgi:carbon-monoxide dehydrogenase medium subunit